MLYIEESKEDVKMFDKNNWYIEVRDLSDSQLQEVCKYLVDNYENADTTYETVSHIAMGTTGLLYWDVLCVLNGKYDVHDITHNDLEDCTKITYQDFVEHLLNPSKMDSEEVSKETGTNTQDGIEQPLKRITELCSRNDITLTFTNQLRVEVYSDFGEWYIDLTEENAEEELLKIIEAVKVLNEANGL